MSWGPHRLVLLMREAFFEECRRNRNFIVDCFISIWNKSFWSVFYLAHRDAQPSILSLGERSLRLVDCSHSPSEVTRGLRESHLHQVTPLASRVTTATGSLPIATREAAGTSPPIASLLYPPLSRASPGSTEHSAGSVFMELRLFQRSLLSP